MVLVACGSVGGADAEFWKPAQGIATIGPEASGGAGAVVGGGGVWQGGAGGSSNGGTRAAGGVQGLGGVIAPGGFQGGGGDVGTGGFIGDTGGVMGTGGSFGGTGGALGTGGTNSGTCSFRFDVTTTSYGGRFGPRNVGAIYVVSSSGAFVKTLNVWGTVELPQLTDWRQLSGGNTVDAVTGATRSNAGPVSGSWDCTDVNRQAVQDGPYQVCCSFQEDDSLPFFGPAPKKACVAFTKGAPFTISAPDQSNFSHMTLTMQ
jgi:hypothetical protein